MKETIGVAGTPVFVRGFVRGLRHPAIIANVSLAPAHGSLAWVDALEQALSSRLEGNPGRPPGWSREPRSRVAGSLLQAAYLLQVEANLPVSEPGRVFAASDGGPATIALCAPHGMAEAAMAALRWALKTYNAAAGGEEASRCVADLPALLEVLRRWTPKAGNVPRFLHAAFEQGIPTALVAGNVYRFGQGRHARWMDSTITDATPQLGVGLARRKDHCAAILREAGLPAPTHESARSAGAAAAVAQRLGYPVVVKPADLDGGAGVAVGLLDAAEVERAFEQALKLSKHILVEKHFEGRDYRMTVLHGELMWAVERQPGGVTGDGVRTVEALLAEVNADPRRGTGKHASLKLIHADAEAMDLLARQQLTLQGVPPPGAFVRLRRVSNVNVGGVPTAVTQLVHADNRELAVRAAAALRLDCAGVDLIMPDVTRSWLETGALVCEVNAQPSLGWATSAQLYGEMLREMMDGDGRVPVVAVIGAAHPAQLATQVAAILAPHGMATGWATADAAGLGSMQLSRGPLTALEGSAILIAERRVDAALLFLNDLSAPTTGLAFDRLDAVLLAGHSFAAPVGRTAAPGPHTQKLLGACLPACTGPVATCDTSARVSIGAREGGPPRIAEAVDAARAAQWLADTLVRAQARHRHP